MFLFRVILVEFRGVRGEISARFWKSGETFFRLLTYFPRLLIMSERDGGLIKGGTFSFVDKGEIREFFEARRKTVFGLRGRE